MSKDKMTPAPMLPKDTGLPELTEENSVLVFAIEGDDGEVFEKRMHTAARPNLTYGYLRRVRRDGQVEAEAWMMEQVLGDDGLEALENYEGLTPDLDEAIKKRVRDITSGGVQNAQSGKA